MFGPGISVELVGKREWCVGGGDITTRLWREIYRGCHEIKKRQLPLSLVEIKKKFLKARWGKSDKKGESEHEREVARGQMAGRAEKNGLVSNV